MRNDITFTEALRDWVERRRKGKYVQLVMRDTGWTKEKTADEMNKARDLGFSYVYYAKHKLWTKTEEQLRKHASYRQGHEIRRKAEHDSDFAYVLQQTGWSRLRAKRKIRRAHRICGSSLYDYTLFQMWKLTEEQQRTFYTFEVFSQLYDKDNTDPAAVQTLVYKGRFAKAFSDLMHRRWFTNGSSLTRANFSKKIAGLPAVFAKPTGSTKGKGAELIRFYDFESEDALYDYINSKEYMIFEEVIQQHPAMAAINASAVNTIRVVTITEHGVCHHVFTSFRIGAGKLVDNFSAGGMVADIDPQTGVVRTAAFNREGTPFARHPLSGHPIKGFQIPHWDKVLQITETAALRMAAQGVGIVGWDVAVGAEDVYLVEGNSRPGHELPQLPYVDVQKGVRSVVEPFLPPIAGKGSKIK